MPTRFTFRAASTACLAFALPLTAHAAVPPNDPCSIMGPSTPNDGCGDTLFAAPQLNYTYPNCVMMAPVSANGGWNLLAWGTTAFNVLSDPDGNGVFETMQAGTGGGGGPTGNAASDGVHGDFDGDGDQDVVLIYASQSVPALTYLRNTNGQLAPVSMTSSPNTSRDVAVGDLNGDGKDDLVAGRWSPFGFHIYRGLVGGLSQHVTFSLGSPLRGVAIGDVDSDSDPDIVVSVSHTNGIAPGAVIVYRNNGAWSFTPLPQVAMPAPLGEVRAGDIDGDGHCEFVARQLGDDNSLKHCWVLRWQGTQLAVVQDLVFETGLVDHTLLDLNHDSHLDMVTGGAKASGAFTTSGFIKSFYGNASGTFDVAAEHVFSRPIVRMAIADLDADGHPELAMSSSDEGDKVAVLKGRPNGTWALPFQTPVSGNIANEIAAGDFNGDCLDDLAVTSEDGARLQVLQNSEAGTFQQVFFWQVSGEPQQAPTWVDLNGDQLLDLVVARGTLSRLEIRYKKPNGTLGPVVNTTCLTCVGPMRAADLNGDGTTDLAVCGSAPRINILLTNAQGLPTGNLAIVTVPYIPLALDLADFDGDGNMDVAVQFLDSHVGVYFNDGSANFTLHAEYPGGWTPAVAAADFNGDGLPDLATSAMAPTADYSHVGVRFNVGGGAFGPLLALPTHYGNFKMAVHDFNGDGTTDIVAMHDSGPSPDRDCSVFVNNGDGTFQAERRYMLDSFRGNAALGHFNRDGRIDIAASTLGSAVEINLSQQCMVTNLVGDLNHDGLVDGCDLGLMLGQWGLSGPEIAADLNADGVVDGVDLGMLLGGWTG